MRVLVVDDDLVARRVLAGLLKARGATEIVEAADGDEALTFMQENGGDLDLVLLDWVMPGRDGLAVARALRAEGCRVPIVMVTAETRRSAVVEAAELGLAGYIVKPIEREEVGQKLDKILEHLRVRRSLAVYLVHHAMRTDVPTVLPSTSVHEAITLLLEHGVNGLPVVTDQGQLVGMVTEFDLLQQVVRPDATTLPISAIMSQDLLMVNETTLISDAIQLIRDKRVREVLVCRDGRLAGVVSRRALLEYLSKNREKLLDLFANLRKALFSPLAGPSQGSPALST
jgi:two-component system chemotaxis response regulator CheY